MREQLRCPVCGAMRQEESLCDCAECGFVNAYPALFASASGARRWRERAARAGEGFAAKRRLSYARGGLFEIAPDAVLHVSAEEGILTCVPEHSARLPKRDAGHIVQVSLAEKNTAFLYADGTVEVTGDNLYGQCDTQGFSDIVHVLCAPQCIYMVDRAGHVHTAGTPASAGVARGIPGWEQVTQLAAGSFHLLGLTRDGSVLCAGDIEMELERTIASWKNVKAIAAATKGSFALREDGTVLFAGWYSDTRRKAEEFRDIIALRADSAYAVGLTGDGRVLLAGGASAATDMGRQAAAAWTGVLAISCCRSGIGALTETGDILLAGNIAGRERLMREYRKGA